jgi:prevent-host-death family protein
MERDRAGDLPLLLRQAACVFLLSGMLWRLAAVPRRILVASMYKWYNLYMTVNLSKARIALPELVNRAAFGKERSVISRHGKEIVAIVPIEDLRLLEKMQNRRDLAAAKRRLAEKGKTISHAEMKRRHGL